MRKLVKCKKKMWREVDEQKFDHKININNSYMTLVDIISQRHKFKYQKEKYNEGSRPSQARPYIKIKTNIIKTYN